MGSRIRPPVGISMMEITLQNPDNYVSVARMPVAMPLPAASLSYPICQAVSATMNTWTRHIQDTSKMLQEAMAMIQRAALFLLSQH